MDEGLDLRGRAREQREGLEEMRAEDSVEIVRQKATLSAGSESSSESSSRVQLQVGKSLAPFPCSEDRPVLRGLLRSPPSLLAMPKLSERLAAADDSAPTEEELQLSERFRAQHARRVAERASSPPHSLVPGALRAVRCGWRGPRPSCK